MATARLVVMTGVILGLLIIAWLALGEINRSSNAPAVPSARSVIETPLEWRSQYATDADRYFDEHARATEKGFIAAFPFHPQSRRAPASAPGTKLGNAASS